VPKKTLTAAVASEVRALLAQHTADCGRTPSREGELWLRFGASAIEWVSTLGPQAAERLMAAKPDGPGLSAEEVEVVREQLRQRMLRDLAVALPRNLDPRAVLASALPMLSVN